MRELCLDCGWAGGVDVLRGGCPNSRIAFLVCFRFVVKRPPGLVHEQIRGIVEWLASNNSVQTFTCDLKVHVANSLTQVKGDDSFFHEEKGLLVVPLCAPLEWGAKEIRT